MTDIFGHRAPGYAGHDEMREKAEHTMGKYLKNAFGGHNHHEHGRHHNLTKEQTDMHMPKHVHNPHLEAPNLHQVRRAFAEGGHAEGGRSEGCMRRGGHKRHHHAEGSHAEGGMRKGGHRKHHEEGGHSEGGMKHGGHHAHHKHHGKKYGIGGMVAGNLAAPFLEKIPGIGGLLGGGARMLGGFLPFEKGGHSEGAMKRGGHKVGRHHGHHEHHHEGHKLHAHNPSAKHKQHELHQKELRELENVRHHIGEEGKLKHGGRHPHHAEGGKLAAGGEHLRHGGHHHKHHEHHKHHGHRYADGGSVYESEMVGQTPHHKSHFNYEKGMVGEHHERHKFAMGGVGKIRHKEATTSGKPITKRHPVGSPYK